MEPTWRWFGPKDPIPLSDIVQTGATGIVSALHDIPNGEVWPIKNITEHKNLIESYGLQWSVVESVPVHEEIKTRTGNFHQWIQNYQTTLRNLASCGITTVCYNFMPVLDWTRTDLSYELPDGTRALRFDQTAFAAFELFILKRPGAEDNYSEEELHSAEDYYNSLNNLQIKSLTANIIAGLPGSEEGYTLQQFQAELDRYKDTDTTELREHLKLFLLELMPVCEELGIRLAIHPDDPPRPILGLPRVVSTLEDMNWLTQAVPSAMNGFTMCTGSYGVRADNDLAHMIHQHKERIFFTHLRSTRRDEDNPLSFYEAPHIGGDVAMVKVVEALIEAEELQSHLGLSSSLPMRPDHGHQMLDDLKKKTNPGYSCIGRMKGLAEVRGIEMAIKSMKSQN